MSIISDNIDSLGCISNLSSNSEHKLNTKLCCQFKKKSPLRGEIINKKMFLIGCVLNWMPTLYHSSHSSELWACPRMKLRRLSRPSGRFCRDQHAGEQGRPRSASFPSCVDASRNVETEIVCTKKAPRWRHRLIPEKILRFRTVPSHSFFNLRRQETPTLDG